MEIVILKSFTHTQKHQKHVASNYGCKFLCVDDKYSKPFKSYLGKDSVFNFVNNSVINENKYCIEVMKKHFTKKLVTFKKEHEDYKKSAKCWICDNTYVYSDVKISDHCHNNEKNRSSVHRDCNINVKLNHKFVVVFHSLKNHDSYLIMQRLSKFILKPNVIPNGLEKYTS